MKKIIRNGMFVGAFAGISSGIIFLWKKSMQKTKDMQNRYMSYYHLTNQWLQNHFDKKNLEEYLKRKQYNRIAIYGRGTLGELFYREIKESNIEIRAFIDKSVREKYENADGILIGGLDEIERFQDIDAIIVTPIFDYNRIEKELKRKKYTVNVVSLEDVILG